MPFIYPYDAQTSPGSDEELKAHFWLSFVCYMVRCSVGTDGIIPIDNSAHTASWWRKMGVRPEQRAHLLQEMVRRGVAVSETDAGGTRVFVLLRTTDHNYVPLGAMEGPAP